MTPEKIAFIVALYRSQLEEHNIPKNRMNPTKVFTSKEEMLEHAHYLLDGILEYSQDPTKEGKTGRHLGSAQTLLWCAGWYTLEELMNHNRPDE